MIYDIAVIGGGPSGMMAAISASKNSPNSEIILMEKNDRLGRKLAITGHGRCNITNISPLKETLGKYNRKESKFLKPSFYNLKNEKLLDIFREKGLEFKVEENNRVFPITDDANSVINVLESYLKDLNIEIKLNFNVSDVKLDSDLFQIQSNDEIIVSRKLVISTGGATYQNTGSTGDGYKMAQNLSHSISTVKPAACSFVVNDNNLVKLKGLSFKNVKVSFKDSSNKNIESIGDMLISHNGLTGPVIINLSIEFIKNQDFNLLTNSRNFKKTDISIDFLPDLSRENIKEDIINSSTTKREIHNYLTKYLPNKFTFYFLDKIGINKEITMSNLNKKSRNKVVENLKNFNITVENIVDKTAYITVGGVKLDEINNKTLESKLIPNLYFTGEILDIVGPTGGYNLMIAFTTGYLAGQSAATKIN